MRSGFLPDRIVHLHPTRLCNLACAHCYSESGPTKTSAVDSGDILDALRVLRFEGYESISFSGGEPLLYADLPAVVAGALSLGYRLTIVTNGFLIPPRCEKLLSRFDGIAVSFDGLAAEHNAVRGRSDAFERASENLQRLAAQGLPVGAALSLTRDAIPQLPDLVDHLVSLGARAIQVRPVARAGRAREMAAGAFLRSADLARLFLVVLALRLELGGDVRLHCDVVPASSLWAERQRYTALINSSADAPSSCLLSDLVNPLVITDHGVLKPIAYDFANDYDIAGLNGALHDAIMDYKARGVHALRNLIAGMVASLESNQGLIDWYDACTRASERLRPAVASERPTDSVEASWSAWNVVSGPAARA